MSCTLITVSIWFPMHAKSIHLPLNTGDVVRIAPNEVRTSTSMLPRRSLISTPFAPQLHFANPDAYNELYHPSRRWAKEPNLYGKLMDGNSTWTFLDYPSAKKRREVLLNHFSRKSVLELQHLVQERVRLFSVSPMTCAHIPSMLLARYPVYRHFASRCGRQIVRLLPRFQVLLP